MRGANATMRAFWPRLAAGLVGDLFHPVIQLGYAFESGDAELIAQGLAWCSTAFTLLPAAPRPVPRLRVPPAQALAMLHRDPHAFPNYTQEVCLCRALARGYLCCVWHTAAPTVLQP